MNNKKKIDSRPLQLLKKFLAVGLLAFLLAIDAPREALITALKSIPLEPVKAWLESTRDDLISLENWLRANGSAGNNP